MRDCAFVYASFDKGTHRCRVDTNPLYEVPPSSTLSQKCLDHISENFLLPTYLLSGVNIQARILLASIFFSVWETHQVSEKASQGCGEGHHLLGEC